MNGNTTNGNSKPITHEEIELTLLRFQASGGLITKLPDQEAPRGAVVGSKWALYEPFFETFSILDTGSLHDPMAPHPHTGPNGPTVAAHSLEFEGDLS